MRLDESPDSMTTDLAEGESVPLPELLIVGDVFGFLPDEADLPDPIGCGHRRLDLAELSGRPDLEGERLHAHLFTEGGFGEAVDRLRAIGGGPRTIGLGFSAGGSVLWRAAANGLRLGALICVSSTRLRHETTSLEIPTRVFWAGDDGGRPSEAWNHAVADAAIVYPGESHAFYRHRTSPAARTLWADLRRTIAEIRATAG
jgi:hypothetical protein